MTISTDHGNIPVFTQGDRLRKARQLTGLSTRDFAERIGVSQKSVTNAEGDHVRTRPIVLNAWALATGVPREWLETGVAPEHDPRGDGEAGSTVGYSRSFGTTARPLRAVGLGAVA